MSWWSTIRSVGDAIGLGTGDSTPLDCALGKAVYSETKRATAIVNVLRQPRPLQPATIARLRPLYPKLDLTQVRVRTRCRLPSNRFQPSGNIYAMTFGSTIWFRDEIDETNPETLVEIIHELVHVDQVRRLGGESNFACEYGRGYVAGGGSLPAYITAPSAYYRNPLEAEAYTFESRFRDAAGNVVPAKLPTA